MTNRAGLPAGVLVAFYGDDFTGSSGRHGGDDLRRFAGGDVCRDADA